MSNNKKLDLCPYCNDPQLPEDMRTINVGDGTPKCICKSCLELAILQFEEEFGQPTENKKNVVEEKQEFLSPIDFKNILDSFVIGQEHVTKSLAVSIHKQLTKNSYPNILNNQNELNNVLIIGPTGCGKTYLAEIIAKYANLPFVPVNVTEFTAVGYEGSSVNAIVKKVYESCNHDISLAEKALVFIDEIDKIRSHGKTSGVDVGGESVQDQLLKIIGGSPIDIQMGNKTITINTHNMLFIAAGAFSGILDYLPPEKRPGKKSKTVGFNLNSNPKDEIDEDLAYRSITSIELFKFGMKPEFIGRFPKILALNNLKKQDLINILTKAKNNPLDAKIKFFNVKGIDLEIKDEVFETIADMAIKKKTGARGLSNSLEEILENTIFYGCSDKSVVKCIVTKEMALNPNIDPILIKESTSTNKE